MNKTIQVGEFTVEICRSVRKTLTLKTGKNGKIIASAPLMLEERRIVEFVEQKKERLRKMLEREAKNSAVQPLTAEECAALKACANAEIPALVEKYAAQMGVSYNRVTIRMQKTRWGSCSSKGNLNFNALLMLTPPEVRDSVVVHELAHRKEMNHSRKFYEQVYAAFPQYDECHRWLNEHGSALLARVKEEKQ